MSKHVFYPAGGATLFLTCSRALQAWLARLKSMIELAVTALSQLADDVFSIPGRKIGGIFAKSCCCWTDGCFYESLLLYTPSLYTSCSPDLQGRRTMKRSCECTDQVATLSDSMRIPSI